ncbi:MULTISPECIES: lipoprotein [Metabacillus]|uniref:Lipoprotein n=1 Tax=Metabacillus hrfriensis TaxID=3048891 RepID=A0ACD4R9M0_9BACI|nr:MULTISPECIES: lipoprotein [Metabacillus]UAL51663.1 lipoprotein [Metabacillus dongyingensis]USK27970.1 lipoprotein [Bacillus sp. CMF21]WHZ57178.1 lipoprotein [Metabacillus sp. CT-WN-B3]
MKKIRKHLLLLALGTAILLTGCSKAEQNIHTADEEWPRIIKANQYS